MSVNLKQAVTNAGGYSAVARKMTALRKILEPDARVTKQVIWSWVNVLGRVPAEQVMALETATGIPRQDIRPDIYPPDREQMP